MTDGWALTPVTDADLPPSDPDVARAKAYASTLAGGADDPWKGYVDPQKAIADAWTRSASAGLSPVDMGAGLTRVLANATGDNALKARGLADMVTLPGRVAKGDVPIDSREAQDWAPQMATLLAGGLPGAERGAVGVAGGRLAQDAVRDTVGDYALTPVNDAGQPIIAYHGSPHDFNRFSTDAIGSGEGAQVYGHGLYFAQNEKVAQSYRDALAGDYKFPTLSPDENDHLKPLFAADATADQVRQTAAALAAQKDATIAQLRDQAANPTPRPLSNGDPLASAAYDVMYPDARSLKRQIAQHGADADLYRQVADLPDERIAQNVGRMYQVGINADPAHFLDWDAPLSAQHPVVQNALSDMHPQATGSQIYSQMSSNDPAALTEALKARGVPGISYLDAGSRSGSGASRNYVVFDDKMIDILKKYGIAGLGIGGAGGAALFGGTPDAQAAPHYRLTPVDNHGREVRQ